MLVSFTSVIFALCMYYQIIIQLLYMQDWVAISFSRGSSWHGDWTWVSCIAGRFFTIWATREALIFYQKYIHKWKKLKKNLLSKPYVSFVICIQFALIIFSFPWCSKHTHLLPYTCRSFPVLCSGIFLVPWMLFPSFSSQWIMAHFSAICFHLYYIFPYSAVVFAWVL